MSAETLLEVEGLTVEFRTADGPLRSHYERSEPRAAGSGLRSHYERSEPRAAGSGLRSHYERSEPRAAGSGLRAVDDVSFAVPRGRTVGMVGESGSGKSVTALSLLGLLDARTASVAGRARLGPDDLLAMDAAALRSVRGRRVGMVFQDPAASLDPFWRVGSQIAEAIRLHERVSRAEARARALALLREVGIPAPEERLDAYPHQLSGGMRQRVMIAIALACRPELVIADEPTTALDVTIQAQILELLGRLRRERGTSLLLITHDLGLVAESCDDVVVLYAGRVVERGPAAEVLRAPLHPYTAGLLASTPVPGSGAGRLTEIPGTVPDLRALPAGCRFRDRCPGAQARCADEEPALVAIGTRAHRCHFPLAAPTAGASAGHGTSSAGNGAAGEGAR